MKITKLCTIIILLFSLCDDAYAYCIMSDGGDCPQSGTGWPGATATFYSKGFSGSNSTFDDAFVEALNNWNNLSNFSYSSTNASEDPCNGYNNVSGWQFGPTHCGTAFGSATLATTVTYANDFTPSINTILDANIVFNTAYTWDVHNGYGTNSDFRRVATHELGHALGLDHENDKISIMSTNITHTIEVPQSDDIDGLIALYGGSPSCTYSISSTDQSFESSGGTDSVSVTTLSGCSWTATSSSTWITITSGSNEISSGTVNFSVSENTSTSGRTGSMTIAGKTFTVTQAGQVQIDPTLDIKANGSDGSIITETGDQLSIAISLDPGSYSGTSAVWYIVVEAPSGWQSFNLSQLDYSTSGLSALVQDFGLISFGPAEIFSTFSLSVGTYTYYFAVSLSGQLYYDIVTVTVDN